MMHFYELIQKRRSVRVFRPLPVEEDKLAKILEAARLAPSAGNLQAYEIYAVAGEDARKALARAAYGQDFIAAAPIVLVFCAHPARSEPRYGLRGRDLYAIQDATIACCWAMLAAVDQGLATVWVGSFDPEEARNLIGAPEGQLPVAMLPIGYPGEDPPAKPRRELDDLIHRVG
jgi:nitroreductase